MSRRPAPPGSFAGRLAILLLLAPLTARAQGGDDWFGRDKALHFSFSAAIAGAGYGGASLATEDRRWRLGVGGGVAIAAGTGKEIADAYGLGDPSWKDFTWDLIGTATGLGIAYVIDRWLAVPPQRVRHPE